MQTDPVPPLSLLLNFSFLTTSAFLAILFHIPATYARSIRACPLPTPLLYPSKINNNPICNSPGASVTDLLPSHVHALEIQLGNCVSFPACLDEVQLTSSLYASDHQKSKFLLNVSHRLLSLSPLLYLILPPFRPPLCSYSRNSARLSGIELPNRCRRRHRPMLARY